MHSIYFRGVYKDPLIFVVKIKIHLSVSFVVNVVSCGIDDMTHLREIL